MAEQKINGTSYRVDKMLATEALRLQFRVIKVLGTAVDRLPEILKGDSANLSAGVAVLADIFAKNDPDELVGLIKSVVVVA